MFLGLSVCLRGAIVLACKRWAFRGDRILFGALGVFRPRGGGGGVRRGERRGGGGWGGG